MRNTAKAQEGQIENIDDGMWKVIHQEANVTDEYKAPIEYDVISSTRTKNVIKTRVDDDVDLFTPRNQK